MNDIDTGRQQKQTECSDETQTHTVLTSSSQTAKRVRVQVRVVTGVGGHDLPSFHSALASAKWPITGTIYALTLNLSSSF